MKNASHNEIFELQIRECTAGINDPVLMNLSKSFELLSNVLYLNKMLFKFGKSGSPLCSFCNVKDETPYHLFYECSHTNSLWNQLRHFLSNSLKIPLLNPHSAIFGSINQKENFLIINHLIFIFKFYIYNSRSSSKLNIEYLKIIIYKTRNIELEVSKTETIRNQKYIKNGNLYL